jgi:hypothetical protein
MPFTDPRKMAQVAAIMQYPNRDLFMFYDREKFYSARVNTATTKIRNGALPMRFGPFSVKTKQGSVSVLLVVLWAPLCPLNSKLLILALKHEQGEQATEFRLEEAWTRRLAFEQISGLDKMPQPKWLRHAANNKFSKIRKVMDTATLIQWFIAIYPLRDSLPAKKASSYNFKFQFNNSLSAKVKLRAVKHTAQRNDGTIGPNFSGEDLMSSDDPNVYRHIEKRKRDDAEAEAEKEKWKDSINRPRGPIPDYARVLEYVPPSQKRSRNK